MKDMPKDLVLPLVIATVFGMFAAMGVLGSCMGSMSMLAQPTYPPMPGPMQEPFDQIMARSQMLTAASVGLSLLLMLPTAVLLLGGALATVLKRAIGGWLLSAGFVWATLAELLMFAYGIAVQAWILGPTMELMDSIGQMPTHGTPPPWLEYMGSIMAVFIGVAMLISLAWLALKLAAYLWAARRLKSEEIASWYAGLAEGA